MDLQGILAPYAEDVFFATYWEKQPLHIRRQRQGGYFRDLLTLNSLNRMLSELLFRVDECKAARDGEIIPSSAYVAEAPMRVMERTAPDYVNTARLLGLFAQGATLVFSQLSHKWHPLQVLKQALEKHLAATVVTNVFLTNRQSRGFSVHYDSHDIFVLQLHGAKRWSIYASPLALPLKSQAFGIGSVEKGSLIAEVILNAGDVLYLPRGYFHEARTMDTVSLHLTLGIHPYLWLDYLTDLLRRVGHQTVSLRESVPRNFLGMPAEQRMKQLRDVASDFIDRPDVASQVYASALRRKREASMFSVHDHLSAILAGHDLAPGSRIAKREAGAVLDTVRRRNSIKVKYLGQTFVFPSSYEPMVEAVQERSEFTPGELPGRMAPEQKIRFVAKLIGAGFLWTLPENGFGGASTAADTGLEPCAGLHQGENSRCGVP